MTLRKRNGSPIDDVEWLLVAGIVGVVGYAIYKGYSAGGIQALANATGEAWSGLFSAPQGLDLSHTSYAIPGTGKTLSDLYAEGYTQAQIDQMLADANQQFGTPLVVAPAQPTVDTAPWAGVVSALGF